MIDVLTEEVWFQIGFWSLVLALAAGVVRVVSHRLTGAMAQLGWWSVLLATLAFVLSLWQRSITADYFALSNMYESLLTLAILMLAGFLVMDKWFNVRSLAWPVCLLGLGTVGFAATLPTEITPLQAALQSYWRAIHVPVIIASYAAFTLSFICSAAYLVTDALSSRQAVSASAGGSVSGGMGILDKYDEVAYRCISVGFPLLAIGIILGGLWANEAWGNYWSWDPKESMSLVTLLAYGVYLHLRVNGEHSPKVLAWASVAGFVMMLITYFGVNIMGLGLHSYGKIG